MGFFYRCGLPVCDEVCENGNLHASYECPIFAKAFDNNEATENPDCGIFTSCGDYSSGAKNWKMIKLLLIHYILSSINPK